MTEDSERTNERAECWMNRINIVLNLIWTHYLMNVYIIICEIS